LTTTILLPLARCLYLDEARLDAFASMIKRRYIPTNATSPEEHLRLFQDRKVSLDLVQLQGSGHMQ
jgi:hypothetical protein